MREWKNVTKQVTIRKGAGQSDANGYGLVAKCDIAVGTRFRDLTTEFVSRNPDYAQAHFGEYDYIAFGKKGYFIVRELKIYIFHKRPKRRC